MLNETELSQYMTLDAKIFNDIEAYCRIDERRKFDIVHYEIRIENGEYWVYYWFRYHRDYPCDITQKRVTMKELNQKLEAQND